MYGGLAADVGENRAQNREYLDVAVVVHADLVVGLEVERVDHVDVFKVCGGGLVREVDRVVERQVPDRERLEFRVAGLHAPLLLKVELRQAGRHLPASRTRRGDNNKPLRGLDVVVPAEALLAHYQIHVVGVTRNRVVLVNLHAERLEAVDELVGVRLAGVTGDDHASHVKPGVAESVNETQRVEIVRNAEVAAFFVFFDCFRVDCNDDFGFVPELEQHFQLGVRQEPRKHPRGVVVVEKFAPEFKVELSAEHFDPLADLLAL